MHNKKRTKLYVMAAPLLLWASGSVANELPKYDVQAHCEKIANTAGGSETIENTCIDMEQNSYNNLKKIWQEIPEKTQTHCNELATFGGAGSYDLLKTCIDMEASAAANKKEFKY